ncbi:MAG: arylesterase [Burkholderiaceae bacterium]
MGTSLAGLARAGDNARDASGNDPRTLLVVGDSISAEYGLPRGTGWVALLEQRLAAGYPSWRVANASISGETSAGGRTRMPRLLERHAPDLVILELGANDALRGLALESTRANLAAMIEASHEAGATVLLAGMQVPPNYGKAYTTEFANLFRLLADEFETALVPFLLSAIATDQARFQADRIHPNASAQPLMLDTLWPVLEPLLQAPAATASGSGSGSRRRN